MFCTPVHDAEHPLRDAVYGPRWKSRSYVISYTSGLSVIGRRSDRSNEHSREMVPREHGHDPQLPQHNARSSRVSSLLHAPVDYPRLGLDGSGGLHPSLTICQAKPGVIASNLF